MWWHGQAFVFVTALRLWSYLHKFTYSYYGIYLFSVCAMQNLFNLNSLGNSARMMKLVLKCYVRKELLNLT